MSDELERLEAVLSVTNYLSNCAAVVVTRQTIVDAQATIERLQAEHEDKAELKAALVERYAAWWNSTSGTPYQIARLVMSLMSDEIERLKSLADVKTGMAWMRSCDELTEECLRHKAEIERLQKLLSGARHSRRNWVIEWGWNAALNHGGYFVRRNSAITSQWAGRTIDEAWAKVAEEAGEVTE